MKVVSTAHLLLSHRLQVSVQLGSVHLETEGGGVFISTLTVFVTASWEDKSLFDPDVPCSRHTYPFTWPQNQPWAKKKEPVRRAARSAARKQPLYLALG